MYITIKARKGQTDIDDSESAEIENRHAFLCFLERNRAGPTLETFQKLKYITSTWEEMSEIKASFDAGILD